MARVRLPEDAISVYFLVLSWNEEHYLRAPSPLSILFFIIFTLPTFLSVPQRLGSYHIRDSAFL